MFGTVEVEQGVYYNVDEDEYRSWNAANYSFLKDIGVSEYYAYMRTLKKKETKSMDLGKYLDCGILTPELLKGKYIMTPEEYPAKAKYPSMEASEYKKWSGNSTWCKAWKVEQEDNRKVIYSQSDKEALLTMRTSIRRHKRAGDLLTGESQVAYVWVDPSTGIKCKCLVDKLCSLTNSLVDFKTAKDASENGFRSAMTNYKYHFQAAFYISGHYVVELPENPFSFDWVVGENHYPYDVATFSCREQSLRTGLKLMYEGLNRYAIMKAKRDKYFRQKEIILKDNPKAEVIPEKYFYKYQNSKAEAARLQWLEANKNSVIAPEASIYSGFIRQDELAVEDNVDINIDVFPYAICPDEELKEDLWTTGIPGGEKNREKWEAVLVARGIRN